MVGGSARVSSALSVVTGSGFLAALFVLALDLPLDEAAAGSGGNAATVAWPLGATLAARSGRGDATGSSPCHGISTGALEPAAGGTTTDGTAAAGATAA